MTSVREEVKQVKFKPGTKEGVMDEQSGESKEEEVVGERIGESEMEELVPEKGWRRDKESWFQRQYNIYCIALSMIGLMCKMMSVKNIMMHTSCLETTCALPS